LRRADNRPESQTIVSKSAPFHKQRQFNFSINNDKKNTMTTPHTQLIDRSPLRRGCLFITLALAGSALAPHARAVCQQGCDPSNGNTFFGEDALPNNTGTSNTAIGFQTLHGDIGGSENTATGFKALFQNAGPLNTANGANALQNNVNGYQNTAVGAYALYSNIGAYGGGNNTATGAYALYSNTGLGRGSNGANNTASGVSALFSNTDGGDNTAAGVSALAENTTGDRNTATGVSALGGNTTGDRNTATGSFALYANKTGRENMAAGSSALSQNITGNRNVATGASALFNNTTGDLNTAEGFQALYHNRAGSNNIGLGVNAGSNLTSGNGNVCIGYNVLGVAGESNTTRISNIYYSAASARAVYVNSDNKIGTLVSSRRFKDEIKSMDKASDVILALKPVTFRYKKEIDASGTLQFGLVAEEVADIDGDLVTRDAEGKPETVRYDAVNAMLLNEFIREHQAFIEEQHKVATLDAAVAGLMATVKEQAAQLRKVSARIEASNAAPQVVNNP
jgi:hypothetical protein